jgi:hypothetical protein
MSLPHPWVSASCKGLVAATIFLVCFSSVHAQQKRQRPLRAALDVNWTLNISAREFFDDYRTLLGGTASGFDVPEGLTLSVGSFLLEDGAIGLSAGYYRAVVRESYDYNPKLYAQPTGPSQSATQDIMLTVIPAYVTLDYFPVERQFTGYVGAGVGLASVHFAWTEIMSTSTEPGARLSGTRYDDAQLVPSAMVRAGVSLGFDDPVSKRTFGGLYLEISYIPFSAPVFERTASTLAWRPERTTAPYNIQAGGIVLRLGFEVILMELNKRL